ncbi:Ran-binding protein 10 [Saguinus oedipus]|uniref:Ran-binding protein 10 n=1 Tax=Saguinus oedipus TaxID=9490 RepID=A0ABQ9TLH6_SAGOE|nr:Ran-binding protein 10 [Saguinus oedipus]
MLLGGPWFTHSNSWLELERRPNQAAPTTPPGPTTTSTLPHSDSEMEMEAEHYPNGVLGSMSTRIVNGAYKHEDLQTDESSMDDGHPRRQLCGGNQAATERIILFGRELQALSEQLGREYGKNLAHTEMLQDAFSLLAYSDPWSCPVGQQLDPIQREPVCAALNSAILGHDWAQASVELRSSNSWHDFRAIAWWLGHTYTEVLSTLFQENLSTAPSFYPQGNFDLDRVVTRPCLSSTESQNLPKQPPLMLALGQASECLRLMAQAGLGSCSFARVDDYLH